MSRNNHVVATLVMLMLAVFSPFGVAANAMPSAITSLAAEKTCGLINFQQELIAQINLARATGRMCGAIFYPAAAPLVWQSKLFDVAASHSADMALNNYFSHASQDGRSLIQRLKAAGYAGSAMAENIAVGQHTVTEAMQVWIASEGHCKNIMNSIYTEVALACVSSDSSAYGTYWTMNLGRP